MFQLGREVTKVIGGKNYTFSRLERRIVEEFRDWIAEREGDVFAVAREAMALGVDSSLAKELIEDAKDRKSQLAAFSLSCPLALKYLKTELGQAELFYLLLRGKHPEITCDEAFVVWTHLADQAAEIVAKTQGRPPTEKNEDRPAA